MRVIEIKTVDGSRFEFPEDRYALEPKLQIMPGQTTLISKTPVEALSGDKSYITLSNKNGSKRFYFQKHNIAYIVEKYSEEG